MLNNGNQELSIEGVRLRYEYDKVRRDKCTGTGDTLLAYPICKNRIKKSQGYGKTKHIKAYGGMGLEGHPGIDWVADEGELIRAAHDGVVFFVLDDHDNVVDGKIGYGNHVKIRTRDGQKGFETVYAHLKDVHVYEGEPVKRGQIIGTNGNTGFSSAPHLHFGIRFLWFCDDSHSIQRPCEVIDGDNGMMGWVDPKPYM